MISARKPANEGERLNALRGYELLDTEFEDAFDALTKLSSRLLEVPISLVSLIDADRQWFKSQCGLDGVTSTGRDISFCAHAILQSDIFEVTDTREDPRFADNPLVTGDPRIRFYAGMPLITPDGAALGTLCVIDREPRTLSQTQRLQLADLARSVVGLILMRIRSSERDEYRLAHADNDRARTRLKTYTKTLKALSQPNQ